MTSEDLIKNIDFSLLRNQKLTLLNIIENNDNVNQVEDLEGIIGLINEIQDHAVDDLGMNEDEVFIV